MFHVKCRLKCKKRPSTVGQFQKNPFGLNITHLQLTKQCNIETLLALFYVK